MAVNPITSESLTVDFKSLMKIPVGDRMKAANINPDFLQSILSALTPIQIANAFPSYYKRQLPDVSNFITSYIASRNGGNFNQTGGGDGGYSTGYYDTGNAVNGSARPGGVPEPTIQVMKEKLLKNGIDVDGTLNQVKQGAVLESDEKYAYLKKMSDGELKEAGLERVKEEGGNVIIRALPSEYAAMSKEQVLEEYKKSFPATNISPRERATLDFIAKREGAHDPNVVFGGGRYVERLGLDKKPLTEHTVDEVINQIMPKLRELSKADGYGVTNDGRVVGTSAVGTGQMIEGTLKDNLRALGIPEDQWSKIKFDKNLQERLTLQNFKSSGIGDPNADPSTWNMRQLGNQYESLNTSRGHSSMTQQEMADIQKQSPVRPENKDDVKYEDALAKLQEAESIKYNEALTRKSFNAASPTSSEAIPSDGSTRVTIEGEKLKPVGNDYDSLKEFWSQRNPRTDINKVMEVDPDLLKSYAEAVQQYEASNPGFRVELFGPGAASRESGSTSNHGIKADGYSKALDFAIIDRATGKQISNVGSEGYSGQVGGSEVASREYTRLHSLARIAQEYYAPHEPNLRQGGGFVQGVTADWMHGDIRSENMAAYSWEKGYDPNFRRQFNIQENLVLGEEERIRELGQQIYGQVDESGYYTNRADFSQLESGDTTVVSKKVEPPKDKNTVEPVSDQVASATPAETPVPQFALGGNMYGPNEDITLVDNATGNPIAQVGQNEKLEKKGNALQVTSETKLKAEELTNKYDSSTEMEDRMSNIEDSIQNQTQQPVTNQVVQKAREPERVQQETPQRWRESIAMAERPVSPSFSRAMARSKFFAEGHHFNRASPGSQS